MGLLRGRHAAVMFPGELARARESNRLPDVYVGSAEWEVAVDDPNFEALLTVRTRLGKRKRSRIEREEGLRASSPWDPDFFG